MRDHLEACPTCATWDHRVRRSLILARNHLRSIEPSAEFSHRLTARLEAERRARPLTLMAPSPFRWTGVTAVGLVVSVIGVSVMALGSADATVQPARLPAVVQTAWPEDVNAPSTLPNATPAFVASVSTGMAILPALMLAEEMPRRRVSHEDPGIVVRAAGLTYPNQDQR